MLEKVEVIDLIEVFENGCVQVRAKISICENGIKISDKFHRHVIAPSDDYSKEDSRVRSICAAVQTVTVCAEYQASLVQPE